MFCTNFINAIYNTKYYRAFDEMLNKNYLYRYS